ncbi:hypothetical protein Emag_002140 [Eimeria magna]
MVQQWEGVAVISQGMTDSPNHAAKSRFLQCLLQSRLEAGGERRRASKRIPYSLWLVAAVFLMLQMLVQPATALPETEGSSLRQTASTKTKLEQPGFLDFSPGDEDAALPHDVTPASMLQAAAQPNEFSFSTEANPDQEPSAGGSELPSEPKVLSGVNITVTAAIINGMKTMQVAAFKQGNAVAVFNLTSTTEEKERLLRDLSAVADNSEALFTVTWQPTSATAGTLNLKLESSYNANSSVPSVSPLQSAKRDVDPPTLLSKRHVAGRRLVSERVTASIPKDKLLQMKSILEFKDWLASACHPPLLKEGKGFQILVMTLMLHQKSKKKFEVRGEEPALDWLQKVAVRKEPIVAVTGELERNATVEIPFFEQFSWPQLLRLKGLVDDSEKSHVPLSTMSETMPSLRVESFTVPPGWFRMTPQQQYEWWSSGRQPGSAGTSPGQMNLSGLFGPQYPSATTPIFFTDNKGQPLGADKEPGNASLFGSRLTPVENLPDHVFGQFIPGKQGALLTVKINDTPYHVAGDFVEAYPSLLHLLAHLASENPEFLLNSVELIFGASVPRSVNAIFVLETPEGVPPWCIFQFEVPITKRNTVVIKSVMKKAKRAAESPNGCNITNARGLRFETLTAVAKVEQLQPELKTSRRQQLNFRGSQAECRKMGSIFSEAYKSGQLLAVFFSATHLLKGSVEIPRFSKSGEELKPSIKTVSSRVHMNEPYPQLVADFTKPFRKFKVPGMEFPYLQVSGGVEKSALPHGSLPESYYHQSPGKVKITWHPQFPILGDQDTFTDGNGPHRTGGEVNIPIRPGAAGAAGPFNAIQSWLRHHIPDLQLPVDLERMPAEDRNSFFKKIFVEVEGGEKMNLYDILHPLLRSPRWDKFNPADYSVPYHLLTLPVKNVFVEGELEFVVTTPDGAQVSHTLPVRPQESWGSVLDRFYHMFPQYDRATTKLSLFDPAGNPVSVPDESPVYVGVKEAVEQHRKGFEISLETPLGKFTTCYRFDEGNNKCLVVPMHSLFCGKILGISERAKAWEKQCSAADMRSRSVSEVQHFLENSLRGADLFRPVRLRDLLALIRKHVASFRPDVIRNLNLPDPAGSQVEIERLKVQIDKLRALPQKKAEDYDALQKYRRQIKALMSKEVKWASPSSLGFFYVKEKGVQRDLIVPIQDPDIRNADEIWKVYHHATRQSMEAANLDFANVYNITFKVLGIGEREEVKRRIKQLVKEQKQAQKEVSQIKVKVDVSFEVENSEASADSNIEITLPADFANGLRIGGKRRTVAQVAKLYNIPKSYFTLDNYPRVVVDRARGPLPILKVALETVCLRPDGTIAVTPAELAGVLSERGGYAEDDLVFVTTATGERLRVPLKTLRQLQPDKVQKFNFAWKRTLSDISSEAQAQRKEKVEAAFGEVGDPTKWKELLAPWLLRLRSFGPLADTPIQLVVRNDQEPNRNFRRSRCQVATFGELLEYINDFDNLLNACPGLIMVVSKRVPFAFDVGIRAPPPSGFRMWNRAHGDPEKNRRQLERLAAAFEKVTGSTKVSWKFAKHSGTMSPEQIASIQALLQSDKPRDASLVRMILTSLNVPKSDIARLTGRLSILIAHEPTESDKVLLREGLITGIPVVTFQNDYPMGFTFQRPGAPVSSIMPNDIYFNVVQQPGSNVPGATFIQRAPTPTGNIDTSFKYFGSDPQRWGPILDPGTASTPKGTTAEFSFYPDPDQEESNKAFSNPSVKSFKIPGFSHLPEMQQNFNVSFNPNMPSVPGGEIVYIQAPAGNGQYFFCPGVTLQQFLALKSKEEVSKLCGIPIDLLNADILVSAYGPEATPNYAPARPSVPIILIDRVQTPHYYTASWEDNPLKFIDPLLRGGHPGDLVLFSFANSNQCALSRAMLGNLKSWLELTRFCSETFKGVRPTHIVGVVQLQISMPEDLKAKMMSRHNGSSPEDIFAMEPLGVVISNLLVDQPPGFTLETILEMNDGTKINYNTLPEEWRNIPATQIPGLASITIQDLLKQLNIGGQMPFSQFVTKLTDEGNSATGFTVPSTKVHVGGPATPGAPQPHISFEMLQPETIGSSGSPQSFGARFPVAHGTLPETMKMDDVLKMLHNPQVLVHQKPPAEIMITTLTGSNNPFTTKADRLDTSFVEQVDWLKRKLGIDSAQGILVTIMVDGMAYRSSLTAEQLLGHTAASILQLAGAADLEDSHSIIFIEISDMHGTPGMSLVLSFLNALKQVKDIAPGQTLYIDAQVSMSVAFDQMFRGLTQPVKYRPPSDTMRHPNAQIEALLNTPVATVPQGTYLMAFTGSGTNIRKVTIPITPEARKRTIRKLLMHLNIALQTIQELKLVSNVGDESVDFHILNQRYRIPARIITSEDQNTITDLFTQMGKRLQTMLEAAPIQNQSVTLHTTFTKRDGTTFSVDTPLGSGGEVAKTLSQLTLWSLVPEEAVHQHIRHIDMTLTTGGFTTPMSGPSPARPPSQPSDSASSQQAPIQTVS